MSLSIIHSVYLIIDFIFVHWCTIIIQIELWFFLFLWSIYFSFVHYELISDSIMYFRTIIDTSSLVINQQVLPRIPAFFYRRLIVETMVWMSGVLLFRVSATSMWAQGTEQEHLCAYTGMRMKYICACLYMHLSFL